MQQDSRDAYRRAAAECLEIAQSTAETDTRDRLTLLAGKFFELANTPDSDATLKVLIDEFNRSQMRKQV